MNIGGRKSAGLGLLTVESARFHAFEIGTPGDEAGIYLANPFRAPQMSLEEFASWLARA